MAEEMKYKITTLLGDTVETDKIDREKMKGFIICYPPLRTAGTSEECESIELNVDNIISIRINKDLK